ncbi:c-type cytochrome [Ferruginibacter paludis]|uniref:c-type cytochrome n=1 Tax=Ferruginibacter paludis TaxID=1310417 RepID=UPI0025B2EA1B|nr:c-type cytochrome [Ferruginibacter paludis]MDN3658048.1 c-type cytochrome [Ferruginibacter paludis]
MKKLSILLAMVITGFAFASLTNRLNENPEFIAPSKQRTGDVAKGYQYLITGDYLKSGIPFNLFMLGTGKDTTNFLQRDGYNKNLNYSFTAVKAPNGVLVAAPNCLQCHGQVFDGRLIVGLGNSLSDFTQNRQGTALFAEKFLQNLKGEEAKKYDAAKNFIQAIKAVSPELITTTKGVNLADALAALLVSHRDPQTLRWSDKNSFTLPTEMIPTDVPAWWLLKKKNAMFYNGFGRGDFGRFLMGSNLLTVSDTAEAAEVDSHFNDVLAFINSIEAPKYPKPIDAAMAAQGKAVFSATCKKCHGSYGDSASYPNLLIPESIIKTDSALYTANYSNPQMVNWFNNSWFSSGDHPAKLVPYRGYIAPPLDGVWITAPYLHNGSVPDLETLLNSKKRPKYWQRDFAKIDYNYEIPGYKYQVKDAPGNSEVYNTTQKGYSNQGHYFGDKLSDTERRSVIEYLKTL